MVKILQLIPSINPRDGGTVESVKQLSSELISMGCEVEVACCDSAGDPWLASPLPFKVHALGPSHLGVYKYSPRVIPWLKDNAQFYDAVIVNGLWQFNCLAAWRALKKTKTPYFVFPHGMLDPRFKQNYPLKHIKKWLYWPWGVYPALRDAKAVLFSCEEEKLQARQSFWLYKAEERVVHYGISPPTENRDFAISEFMGKFPELNNKRIVLFMGRLHKIKGCDLLIDAFAKVMDLDNRMHLVIAGPDQMGWASELKRKASSLGVEKHITWTGMLEGVMKWGAHYVSEIFCLPSHQESFGVAVVEALACGKPVLISNKINIWREIEKGEAGFIDDDSVEGTTRNLRKWVELFPENLEIMGAAAYRTFLSRFRIQHTAQELLKIIQSG